MNKRTSLASLLAAAWLTAVPTFALADGTPALERWRSYAGVSWDAPAANGTDPKPFAGSVSAPIVGLHFDAAGGAFVSTPRLVSAAAPATLSRLDTTARTGPARLAAFPSVQANATSGPVDQSLRNVLGFHVDRRNGWLWALDLGFVAGESEAPAGAQKLLVIDLASGRTVKRIALDGVADRKGSFLNDVAVDEVRRVAYIADSGLRSAPANLAGLVVVDFDTASARRVLHQDASVMPEAGVKVMSHGEEVWPGKPITLGINGIALSPDNDTLYWTVTSGTRVRTLPTAILRNGGVSVAALAAAVVDLGAVGGHSDGIVTDAKGSLYITDVTRNGIVRLAPSDEAPRLMAADDGVYWPDTAAIGPGGDLYFTASALNRHFAGAVKAGEERYDIWRLPLGNAR